MLPSSLENGVAPLGSKAFEQAIDDLWQTVELCTSLQAQCTSSDLERLIAALDDGATLPACRNCRSTAATATPPPLTNPDPSDGQASHATA